MFSPAHTAGVDESVPWSHYVNLIHDDGSSPIIVEDGHEATRDATTIIGGLPSFSSELDAATTASRAGYPFIWTMRHLWYMIPEAYALMDYTNRCGLVRLSTSAEASAVAAAVLSSLSLQAGTYVTLHVRRGDAKYACNTSVPELTRYVQSSLHNLRNTSDQSSGSSADICTGGVLIRQNCTRALLLLTDETDTGYVESLVARLQNVTPPQLQVVHADPLIAQLSSDPENNFQFAVAMALEATAATQLLRDRQACEVSELSVRNGGLREAIIRDYSLRTFSGIEGQAAKILDGSFFTQDDACVTNSTTESITSKRRRRSAAHAHKAPTGWGSISSWSGVIPWAAPYAPVESTSNKDQ